MISQGRRPACGELVEPPHMVLLISAFSPAKQLLIQAFKGDSRLLSDGLAWSNMVRSGQEIPLIVTVIVTVRNLPSAAGVPESGSKTNHAGGS